MQERELARRIVHFLPDELMWHCQTITCCECGTSNLFRPVPVSPISRFANLDLVESSTVGDYRLGYAWVGVVQEYTHLHITKHTDLLAALSGLAKSIEHLAPGQYLAGLWERDIPLQLSWSSPDWPTPRGHLDVPSFSWVAAKRYVYWYWDRRSYNPQCTLVASTSKLATANPYGNVLACSITLRGRTLESARLLPIPKDLIVIDDLSCDLDHLLQASSNAIDGHGTVVIGFLLFQHYPLGGTKGCVLTVLLLQRDATETAYKRIGIMIMVPSIFFPEDQPEETITII
jgi:hypothetical protein